VAPPDGALAWEEAPAQRARLEQAVERLAGSGYAVEWISPRQARELEPDLRIAVEVDRVAWTPGEGYVEAVSFIGALLAQASRHGAASCPAGA
jgi:glycine/D-amino acid oxidase-like deaminating enzyme